MLKITNKFGSGTLYEGPDLDLIYVRCCGCMTIWAEFLSWANANKSRITKNPDEATDIVVLGCQVTDLAILNNLRNMESLVRAYPGKSYYMGGCMARRFDIPLPEGVKGLDRIFTDYQHIEERTLIDYAPPFWATGFNENTGKPLADGWLFREMYPLRIGTGCSGQCTFCTMREIRGSSSALDDISLIEDEFVSHDDVLAVADSITGAQLSQVCTLALKNRKSVSIRNVEPPVAVSQREIIIQTAEAGLLDILHVPVQSMRDDILERMGRSNKYVSEYLGLVKILRKLGVTCATNVIIDYSGRGDKNDLDSAREQFDYVSWNPYWNGIFDLDAAKERFSYYIINDSI